MKPPFRERTRGKVQYGDGGVSQLPTSIETSGEAILDIRKPSISAHHLSRIDETHKRGT